MTVIIKSLSARFSLSRDRRPPALLAAKNSKAEGGVHARRNECRHDSAVCNLVGVG